MIITSEAVLTHLLWSLHAGGDYRELGRIVY